MTTKPRAYIDLETRGLGPKPTILGVAWAIGDDAGADEWFDTPEQRAILQDVLDNHTTVYFNTPFDVRVLREHGFQVEDFEDTKVIAHCVDPGHEEYTLSACLLRAGLDDKLDYKPEGGWDDAIWTGEMAEYALQDVVQTKALDEQLRAELQSDPKAWHHYETIEKPYADVILLMEATGFYLDLDKLERVKQHLTRKAAGLERVMKRMAGYVPTEAKRYSQETLMGTYVTEEDGLIPAVTTYTTVRSGGACWLADRVHLRQTNREMKLFSKGETYLPAKFEKSVVKYENCPLQEFNPNSGAQVAERLQTLYGWEPVKFTKTGVASTAAEVIEDLDYPLARMVSEYATTQKVLGSFIEPFSHMHVDGVLRGRFNQTGTRTGRLSSSSPNLQNIPTRSTLGQHVRSLVVAPPGHVLVGIDLANIEARLLAEYLARVTGDMSMVQIFLDGIDFHQANADAWGLPRPDAKTALFALIYGAGPEKLGKGDKQRGLQIMAKLEENAASIFALKAATFEAAKRRDGVIHTLFGRRLVYREITEEGAMYTATRLKKEKPEDYADIGVKRLAKSLTSRTERQIFNAALQGTAADILKILTLRVMPAIRRAGARLAAAVHDELIIITPEAYASWLRDQLTAAFTDATMLKYTPVAGDAAIGNAWSEIH